MKRIQIEMKLLFIVFIMVAFSQMIYNTAEAQSGSWNGWREMSWNNHVTDGSGGYFDYGGGVIQLTNNTNSGCSASAVHSGARYNHCDSSFSKCYKVLFGCHDADGMAFTFSYGCNPDNSWNVWGCGGGLGYRHGCAWNQGITIEFDTYNNAGGDGFDATYAGTGDNDEIAIHRNLEATDAGKLTAVSVPNLEDGLEHNVCINYDRVTHVVSVTIDGINRITYDVDNAGLNPSTYFSGCELMTTWSAGTNAGLNWQVVSEGAKIWDYTGSLCPQMLPVEFLAIKAKPTPNSVLVTWSTATETNNKLFQIERSSDLANWVVVGEAEGMNNSTSISEYSFEDESPISGLSYYRIKQIDLDGKYEYSSIASVKIDAFLSIAPNPFDDFIEIRTDVEGEMMITINDLLGKQVYQNSFEVKNGMVRIAPELLPGFYTISIQTKSFISYREIIKR